MLLRVGAMPNAYLDADAGSTKVRTVSSSRPALAQLARLDLHHGLEAPLARRSTGPRRRARRFAVLAGSHRERLAAGGRGRPTCRLGTRTYRALQIGIGRRTAATRPRFGGARRSASAGLRAPAFRAPGRARLGAVIRRTSCARACSPAPSLRRSPRPYLASAALGASAMGVVILDGEGQVAHLDRRRAAGSGPAPVALTAERWSWTSSAIRRRLRACAAPPRDRRRAATTGLGDAARGRRDGRSRWRSSPAGWPRPRGGAAPPSPLLLRRRPGGQDFPATVLRRLHLTRRRGPRRRQILRGNGLDEATSRLGLQHETRPRAHLDTSSPRVNNPSQLTSSAFLLTGAAGYDRSDPFLLSDAHTDPT